MTDQTVEKLIKCFAEASRRYKQEKVSRATRDAAEKFTADAAEEEKERERNHIPTMKERNEHAANEAALFQHN